MAFDEHHPYYAAPGKETLRLSAVLFADILGFSAYSEASQDSLRGEELLRSLLKALRDVYGGLRKQAQWLDERQHYGVKTFTDNLVVGFPMRPATIPDGEWEVGETLRSFAEVQCQLAMAGFLMRGGMALGMFFMDDDVAFGPALVEAAKQDSRGNPPRVVLGSSAEQAVRKYLSYYSRAWYAPQNSYLLVDSDGRVFVHYLSAAWSAWPEGGIRIDLIEGHKRTVERGLRDAAKQPEIMSKYQWSAKYHNAVLREFIDTYGSYEGSSADADPEQMSEHEDARAWADRLEELLIDLPAFDTPPRRLADVYPDNSYG